MINKMKMYQVEIDEKILNYLKLKISKSKKISNQKFFELLLDWYTNFDQHNQNRIEKEIDLIVMATDDYDRKLKIYMNLLLNNLVTEFQICLLIIANLIKQRIEPQQIMNLYYEERANVFVDEIKYIERKI